MLLIKLVLQGAAFPAAAEVIPDKPVKLRGLDIASPGIWAGCGMLQPGIFESSLLNKSSFIYVQ